MNWKYKAILQAILSIIPFGEKINYGLQMITGSHDASKIDGIIKKCIEMNISLLKSGFQSIDGCKILEVGTGWEPVFPITLSLLGAEKVFTYDHVRHIRFNWAKNTLEQIKRNFPLISKSLGISINELKERNKKNIIQVNQDLIKLFKSLKIEYVAPGDATHTGLPDNSLDLFFSCSVLEHVPERVVADITEEAFRTLKPGSFYYNLIGLFDHYVSFDKKISRINYLKYPEFVWRLLAKNKITYLNRLRYSQFIKIIKGCGFEITKTYTRIDEKSLEALKSMKLARRFRNLEPEDLAIDHAEIIARKPS